MSARPLSRGGFTLIELLVVISIIALLVSILLPALGSARQAAGAITCLSNQRQVSLTQHMYSHDNNDMLMPLQDAGPRFTSGWPAHGTLNTWLLQSAAYLGSATNDHKQLPSIFTKEGWCPQFEGIKFLGLPAVEIVDDDGYATIKPGMALNWRPLSTSQTEDRLIVGGVRMDNKQNNHGMPWGSGGSHPRGEGPHAWFKRFEVTHPSVRIELADSNNTQATVMWGSNHTGGAGYGWQTTSDSTLIGELNGSIYTTTDAERHKGGFNFIAYDGHGGNYKYNDHAAYYAFKDPERVGEF